jgi:hypothetical protein
VSKEICSVLAREFRPFIPACFISGLIGKDLGLSPRGKS